MVEIKIFKAGLLSTLLTLFILKRYIFWEKLNNRDVQSFCLLTLDTKSNGWLKGDILLRARVCQRLTIEGNDSTKLN